MTIFVLYLKNYFRYSDATFCIRYNIGLYLKNYRRYSDATVCIRCNLTIRGLSKKLNRTKIVAKRIAQSCEFCVHRIS
ncbi:hypothetical protein O3M35_009715 [Rhynocoris fuscipes]|uniref:Uncharacterized protein n=1 Tax=Rhynocoris fuscipes TaxID=488301 RepID=A0AAW1D4Q5_9HEMI